MIKLYDYKKRLNSGSSSFTGHEKYHNTATCQATILAYVSFHFPIPHYLLAGDRLQLPHRNHARPAVLTFL